MTIRWLFAVFHLLGLGIGLGAVWMRARALSELGREGSLRTVFTADTWWIVALTLWLVTGLVRVLAGLEKPGGYYLHNGFFWAKMGVALVIYVIELWPMTAILHWGLLAGRGQRVELGPAPILAAVSYAQAALLVVATALAVAMARGVG